MCSSFQLPATAGELVLGQVVPARGHKDIRTSSGAFCVLGHVKMVKLLRKIGHIRMEMVGGWEGVYPFTAMLYMWAKRNDTIEKEGILQHPHVLAP